MVFKKDVLVSAATMTRKERWQKSGGIRDRKRSNGVESKKKRKERTAQSNLPYNRLKKQREIKCYLFTRMEEKCLNEIRTQDLLYLATTHSLFNWAMET